MNNLGIIKTVGAATSEIIHISPESVIHIVGIRSNEREAHIQVCPDEIKACLLDFGLESQVFVEHVSHIHILKASRNFVSG